MPPFAVKAVNIAKGSVTPPIGGPWRRHLIVAVSGSATIELDGPEPRRHRLNAGEGALLLDDQVICSIEGFDDSTLIVLSGV